jgi:hypothetical protein
MPTNSVEGLLRIIIRLLTILIRLLSGMPIDEEEMAG